MAKGRFRDKKQFPVAQNAQAQQLSVSASFSGPLPPPAMLASYNDVLENGAERIFALVEEQTHHRMQAENKAIDADIRRGRDGLRAGILLMLLAFAAAGFLIYDEQVIAGVTVICAVVAFIGGAFIYGTISQRQEREERAKLLAGRTNSN